MVHSCPVIALAKMDMARAAFGEAIALYKQGDDRVDQAIVLYSLGSLVSGENPQRAAAYFAESARLYLMIGMTAAHDAALREADKLTKDKFC